MKFRRRERDGLMTDIDSHKTPSPVQAVANALVQLGEETDPERVAQFIKLQTGLDLDPGEVARIQATLCEQARTPPNPDQPPPQDARREPLNAAPR
jgi:hypothetical protein